MTIQRDYLSKATDKQLQVIVSYDRNCPKELLEPVILEMMKRKLFNSWIFNVTRNMTFTELDQDEIEQMGHIGIWKAFKKYKVGVATFATFCTKFILWMFDNYIKKRKAEKRRTTLLSVSMDADEGLQHKFISDGRNVEKTVLMKIHFEEQLNLLTPLQRLAVLYFMEGYRLTEVAKKINKPRQSVERAFHRAVEKMGGEKMNIKFNCGVALT